MSFLALAILGAIAFRNLPVSLMPDTEVPGLRIEVTYANSGPLMMEETLLRPLRLAFQGLYGLEEIESTAASGVGQIELSFSYGTDMKVAYLEANEKLDQALNSLPRDLERPVVKRIRATDIPVVRLQVTSNMHDLQELTDLSKFVLRRRLEQLPGVSLVEMNGAVKRVLRVVPDQDALTILGISEDQLAMALSSANTSLKQIKVREGLYEYDITFANFLDDPDNLRKLRIQRGNGSMVVLDQVALVQAGIEQPLGIHLADGDQGIVFAIHKNAEASFREVNEEIEAVKAQWEEAYPGLTFAFTQSQYRILEESMDQLLLSLLLGIVFSFLILLLFSGEWRSPVLMGVLIPVSLLIAAGIMFILGISINIVSLSGIILGIGILIDNGIIIVDNIAQHRSKSQDLAVACVRGTQEVGPALISSTLTTLSVFVPLVLLGGLAGTLFKVQAYTIAIVLVCSLVSSFVMLPVMYRVLHPSIRSVGWFEAVQSAYKRFQWREGSPVPVIFFVATLIVGVVLVGSLPLRNLPPMRTNDLRVAIQWDNALTLEENEARTRRITEQLQALQYWEADIGKNGIVEEGVNVPYQSLLYLRFTDTEAREVGERQVRDYLGSNFPKASASISRARNPYDQLFESKGHYASVRLRRNVASLLDGRDIIPVMTDRMTIGEGFKEQSAVEVVFVHDRLYAFGLSEAQIIGKLRTQFGDQLITRVNRVNEAIPIVLRGSEKITQEALDQLTVTLGDSVRYPITHFFQLRSTTAPRFITADQAGIFQEIHIPENDRAMMLMDKVSDYAREMGWIVSTRGRFLEARENFRELLLSFALAGVLLFVILTAQFESFRLPLIILAEIPVSISGSLLFLWLFGASINLSSLIGMVVMLGIIVNDSILKVDTINRYRRQGLDTETATRKGGSDRLKPILMTSLTTILALLPVLFGSGLGRDLQGPLAISVIGGLLIGTLCSIYLIPLMYRWLGK